MSLKRKFMVCGCLTLLTGVAEADVFHLSSAVRPAGVADAGLAPRPAAQDGRGPAPGLIDPGVLPPPGANYGPAPGMEHAGPVPPGAPLDSPRLRDMSWIWIGSPPPRRVRVHDIITVIVDEKSEVTQDSRFNRQRNAILKAQLREFVRLDDMLRLKPAAKNQPTIDTQLRSQLNSFGVANSREGMKYKIAATVVDVLPNGTLILEARKSLQTNGDLWEYSLTGRIRSEDVGANNTVLSENVADCVIIKREQGKIRDSTKRGGLLWLYDKLLPF